MKKFSPTTKLCPNEHMPVYTLNETTPIWVLPIACCRLLGDLAMKIDS